MLRLLPAPGAVLLELYLPLNFFLVLVRVKTAAFADVALQDDEIFGTFRFGHTGLENNARCNPAQEPEQSVPLRTRSVSSFQFLVLSSLLERLYGNTITKTCELTPRSSFYGSFQKRLSAERSFCFSDALPTVPADAGMLRFSPLRLYSESVSSERPMFRVDEPL